MPSSWRGRSSTTTITSPTSVPLRSAISSIVSPERTVEVEQVGDVRARRPSSPCRRTGPGSNIVPCSESAITASALGRPWAHRRVPSSGSTAMSTDGGEPSPTCSPLWSIGASSFSPSPITTTPSMWTVCSTACMPSTAAWSAASLSPRPTQRAACSAAASVTRTSSSARLRSGGTSSACVGVGDQATGLPAACAVARCRRRASRRRPSSGSRPAIDTNQPMPRPISPGGSPGRSMTPA